MLWVLWMCLQIVLAEEWAYVAHVIDNKEALRLLNDKEDFIDASKHDGSVSQIFNPCLVLTAYNELEIKQQYTAFDSKNALFCENKDGLTILKHRDAWRSVPKIYRVWDGITIKVQAILLADSCSVADQLVCVSLLQKPIKESQQSSIKRQSEQQITTVSAGNDKPIILPLAAVHDAQHLNPTSLVKTHSNGNQASGFARKRPRPEETRNNPHRQEPKGSSGTKRQKPDPQQARVRIVEVNTDESKPFNAHDIDETDTSSAQGRTKGKGVDCKSKMNGRLTYINSNMPPLILGRLRSSNVAPNSTPPSTEGSSNSNAKLKTSNNPALEEEEDATPMGLVPQDGEDWKDADKLGLAGAFRNSVATMEDDLLEEWIKSIES